MKQYKLKTVASEPVFRERFDDLPAARTPAALRDLNNRLLSTRTFRRVDADGMLLVPVDIDVSPFDNSGSSKQGVSFTCKLHDGYAPIFAYASTEGYMLERTATRQTARPERNSGVHRSVEMLKSLGLEVQGLFRLDGVHDAAENMDHFGGHRFIIKRNLRI